MTTNIRLIWYHYSHHSCCTHQSTFVQTWHPQPCPNGCSPQRYSSSNVVETLPFQIKHNKTAALLLENGHPSYLLGALQISIVNSLLSPWNKMFLILIIQMLNQLTHTEKADILESTLARWHFIKMSWDIYAVIAVRGTLKRKITFTNSFIQTYTHSFPLCFSLTITYPCNCTHTCVRDNELNMVILCVHVELEKLEKF